MTIDTIETEAPFKKQRSYASGVNMTLFGVMNLVVDLAPTNRPEKGKSKDFKLVGPTSVSEEPALCEQRYVVVGHEDAGVFTKDELDRGRFIDDGNGNETLVRVSVEERDEVVKGDSNLPDNEITISVFPAAAINASTLPTGSSFRVRPPSKGAAMIPLYLMVRDLVQSQPDMAFVGEITLRGSQKMMRLHVWNGQLIMTELVRPNDLAPVDPIDGEYDARLLAKATELAQETMVEFDPAAFANQIHARVLEFEASKLLELESGTVVAKPKPKAKPAADSADALLAMLDGAIATAKS